MIRRREFITLLGGAAAAWPLAARAQPISKFPTIGFLGGTTSSSLPEWAADFVPRMRELGWVEGRTVAFEYRWADGRTERYAEIAAEFVRLKVDAIVTAGPPTFAAKRATSTIPIVFATNADPVSSGLSRVWPSGWKRDRSVAYITGYWRQTLRSLARGDVRYPSRGNHCQCRLSTSHTGAGGGRGGGPSSRCRDHCVENSKRG